MPTISTTARRLRAYQVTLDRLARPARPAARMAGGPTCSGLARGALALGALARRAHTHRARLVVPSLLVLVPLMPLVPPPKTIALETIALVTLVLLALVPAGAHCCDLAAAISIQSH